MYKDNMKGYKMGKVGDTEFTVGKTPYANPKGPYSAQRANLKSKMPKPDIRAFG